MKRSMFLFLCLLPFQIFAQDLDGTVEKISEAEAKAALNRLAVIMNDNTGNYDLKYHRLELDVNPEMAFISGDVTSYFEAKEDLTQVVFELTGNMTVSNVTQNGTSLEFDQNDNDEVVITLPETQLMGTLDSLTISYSGNPVSSGFGSFEQTTHNGNPIIWTLSEPYGAKGWWPCKQDLIDKIDSVDVYLTTPTFNPNSLENIAVANGLEISQEINGDEKTTRFKHKYPIPAYLIAIAVTNYEVYNHTVENNGSPFEIVNYVYPENLATAQAQTPVTVDIMNLFTDLFEEYPFANEKYGHAQFGWGGGMEHTTVSFMGGFNRGLIAHELAHQWYGDKVTCGSWKDIWLNEGFATYLAGLVIEDFDGNSPFITWKQNRVNSITSLPDGAVYIPDADTLSVNRVFSSRLSYNKGAMVLHMLRKKLGETDFYQGMQDFLVDDDLAYSYAKTPDFQNIMEAASGEDLTEFFNDWIYNEGYPTYNISVDQISPTVVEITIGQTQSHESVSFFEAPVPIRLVGAEGEILDVVLDNSENNQTFTESITFNVTDVFFDPESDLISKNNTISLGIEESLQSAFQLYPNPSKNTIYLKKPESLQVDEIKVYNALGQHVLSSTWSESLDISKLSAGVLFIKIHSNRGVITKTVLKN
ncbi:M1 family aminopeptidase [Mangrovimonas sp. ST2L15]|uniref:M1 family aminopeptidase n=1 Tax=Mangrovimonas sp. ST2L15 TaxID=1645916 RepID=UPI0006B6210A|nr:M1 family aminopeptidase [Mangrovimonas sp. ST2L15]